MADHTDDEIVAAVRLIDQLVTSDNASDLTIRSGSLGPDDDPAGRLVSGELANSVSDFTIGPDGQGVGTFIDALVDLGQKVGRIGGSLAAPATE